MNSIQAVRFLKHVAQASGSRFARTPCTTVVAPTLTRGMASSPAGSLEKTGLYDFHVENGAKMVPFAGFEMPLVYDGVGQVASHNHVRTSAGLFDVGHMVQTTFRGPTTTAFLEWLTPSQFSTMRPYQSTLSLLLNERGGIIDDTVITKHSDDAYYAVTNAGRRKEDLAWIQQKLKEWNRTEGEGKGAVEMELMDGWGLLALQGPAAASYLQSLTSFDLKQLTFGTSAYVPIEGFNLHVARGGYTGEDGFEISIPPNQTVDVAKLLHKGPVQLAGLGTRDSLRLEAGLCLYGNDLDESTGPVEAGLTWVIPKERREKGGFIGAEVVQRVIKGGPMNRRIGLIVEGAPARQGSKIFVGTDEDAVGVVTSGIPSPTLGKNIAMGYVQNGWHKKNTELNVEVRGKKRKAVVTPLPFVKANYYRGEVSA